MFREELYSPTAPASVHLELTRHCNLKCFYCTIRDNNSPSPSHNSLEHFKTIIDKLNAANVFAVSFFGGEPFLYPHIFELGKYSRDSGLETSFLSNGSALKFEEVSKIPEIFRSGTIALNGLEECHDRFVGIIGAFKRTSKVIKELHNLGFPLGIDTLVSASNVSHLREFLAWIEEDLPNISSLFLNVYVPYSQEFPEEEVSQSQLEDIYVLVDEQNRRKAFNGKIQFGTAFPFCLVPEDHQDLRKNCSAGWTFGSVDALGNVRICSWSSEILGNLFTNSLQDIWTKSSGIRRYRSLVWASSSVCNQCDYFNSCLGGCKVTSKDEPYAVATNWKSELHPLKIVKKGTDSEVNFDSVPDTIEYSVNSKLRIRKEPNGGLAYLRERNQFFWVNNTSVEILELLRQGYRTKEITTLLSNEYTTNEEAVKSGVDEALGIMSQMGLIKAVTAEPALRRDNTRGRLFT